MRRPNRSLLALLVGAVVIGAVAGPVTAAPENLTISDVVIEPDPPAPGEPFTLRTTIENRAGGNGSVEIRAVYVRRATGPPEYERVENLGSLGDGQTLTVPIQLTLDQSRNLRVHVSAESTDGEFIRLEYPVYVTVDEPDDVQLSFASTDAVVGAETAVNVTVANGASGPISNLELELEGSAASIRDARRASASVAGGTDRAYGYAVTFDEAGRQPLTATLSYTTDEGYRRTVTRSTTVEVEPAVVDVAVDATVADRGAVDPPVSVELTNFGNVPLTGVTVMAADGDRTVARQLVGEVPAETTRTLTLNVSGLEDTTLDVTASYRAGSASGTASTTLDYRVNPGRIALTGVDVERAEGYVEITGSASNVGLAEVNSVIVRVLPAEGVEPVPPNREYFVGSVPPSDFVSFDLTARVDAGATSVPIEVTYLASGVERTERVTVPVDLGPAPAQEGPSNGNRGLLPIAIGGIVLLGVGVIVYLGWSNRGGD